MDLLAMQATLGNRAVARMIAGQSAPPPRQAGTPIQRMIQIGDKLYYSGEGIKAQLPGKKDKNTELSEWKANVDSMVSETMVAVENAYAIPGMNVGGSPTLGGALNGKVNSGKNIFIYTSVSHMNSFGSRLASAPETIKLMIDPSELLASPRDLTTKYDPGKGCVLQALINIDVPNPSIGSSQQDDAEAWHAFYLDKNIQYDDDAEIYKIYSTLGLQLVWNAPTLWRNLSPKVFTPGSYVFSMAGHNFAVVINDSDDPAERYEPKDAPQNIVTAYQPDLKITYAWRYA